jgi:phosphatidylserine decarboxylase
MTIRSLIAKASQQDHINFLLTNRIPRRLATRFVGWFSRIEHPVVRGPSIGIWRLFSDVDLGDAKQTKFTSMHACFTRELKTDARLIEQDPTVLVSPCDAIVGASGAIAGTTVLQVKGRAYGLEELLGDPEAAKAHRNGCYVTLRLTAGMYHRFHAPHDCRVDQVTYISGDTWNVNPIALKRVDRVFCRNERAVLRTRLISTGHTVTLVPVAAILVAGIKLRFLDLDADARFQGRRVMRCDTSFSKGGEMGWFEHGSTIVLLVPEGITLCENVEEGTTIRMGQPLMRLPASIKSRGEAISSA